MMKILSRVLGGGLAVLLLATATTASAQTPVGGTVALGADVGALIPDSAFEKTLAIDGFAEFYVTPRASGRVLLEWANPGFKNDTQSHFREVNLLFNGVYNWNMGTVHPFVTGGAGVYFIRSKPAIGPDPDGETRGGINFGGGAEFFTNSLTIIKSEARFSVVSHPTNLPDATGFTVTVGLKRYF
jgi:hypothetical protein